MRHNGFGAPLEPLQVLTWVLMLVIVGAFYCIVAPVLPSPLSIVLGTVYGVFAVVALVTGLIACKIDPIDPNVQRYHQNQGDVPAATSEQKTFCFLCQLHVNKGSRHCRYCDKCVDRFDHHCRWLNNCVGRKNYRYFVALLVATFGMTSLQLGLSVWFIVMYHKDDEDFNERVTSRYADLGSTGHVILVYIFAALVLPFVGLLLQLLGFHIMLIHEDLTTYDYIVREQKRERERKAQKQQRLTERARQKKQDHGHRAGGCCNLEMGTRGSAEPDEGAANGAIKGVRTAPTSVVPGKNAGRA